MLNFAKTLVWMLVRFAGSLDINGFIKSIRPPNRGLFSQSTSGLVPGIVWAGVAVILVLLFCSCANAVAVPSAAYRYKSTLVRLAHAEWGLNAPVAAFAAQVHQESGWHKFAVSQVGAKGLTQFMPATAKWIKSINPALLTGTPENPTWALRAMVTYDYWLYRRVKGYNEGDKFWAALRSYNGGLGHWQNEAALVKSLDHKTVDTACGHASRHAVFCSENLGYPRRVLNVIQPAYAAWGRGIVL